MSKSVSQKILELQLVNLDFIIIYFDFDATEKARTQLDWGCSLPLVSSGFSLRQIENFEVQKILDYKMLWGRLVLEVLKIKEKKETYVKYDSKIIFINIISLPDVFAISCVFVIYKSGYWSNDLIVMQNFFIHKLIIENFDQE